MKQAHDYIWSVSREIKIELSKAELWELISSRHHLEKFHTFWKSNKTITIMPYIFNRGSKIWNFFPFFAYTKPKLSNYLDSVLMGLKFFSEKKEVVAANQFGTHSWFS